MSEGQVPDGKPKKADVDKMHAYRDAIRDEQGRRVVEYAAILNPGPEVRFDEGLEALQAVPGIEQGLEWRLGKVLTEALGSAWGWGGGSKMIQLIASVRRKFRGLG